jgi:hypothetical protein
MIGGNMPHCLHPTFLQKILFFLVPTLVFLSTSVTPTQARLKYFDFDISNSPNNVAEQHYDQPNKMTVDMWDYGQCDENCIKWVSQSKLTCGNSFIMDSFVEGDKSVLDEYAPSRLDGGGTTDRSVTKISNYAHDACIQAQLAQNESKLTGDWPRQNARYNGQIALDTVCEAGLSSEYTPNACAAYGTNMGNFAYPIGPMGKIAANRPVVVLFDFSAESPPPDAFLNAQPLILRIVNFSHASTLDKMRERGSKFGAMFAGKDVILVLGNELNNPELEKGSLVNYCQGIAIPDCGAKYVAQFRAFYEGVAGRVKVAAAPLDLLNAQYPAANFYTTARGAYTQADVLAANIYCGADVTACINGSQGFGFYGEPADTEKVITEFGPNPPDVSVAQQVTFLEDNCERATSVTGIVTPLIVNNCTSGGGDWLYYVNGELFDQSGSPQTATCSMSSNGLDQKAQGSLYDYHEGSRPDKLYIPALQSRWAIEGPCKDIIRTIEEGAGYCDINPHCTNPSNICLDDENCRSNYLVCKDLYSAMQVDTDFKLSTNMRQNATNWNKIPPDLKKEINLITETKANVRGFVVVARDLEFTPTRCRWGVLCKQQELPLEVVDLVVPGAEGASHGAENDVKDTTLPQIYDQVRGQVIADAGKIYPETCPSDCELISQDVCESLDLYVGRTNVRGEEYTQSDVNFYKRLVNRICSGTEQLSCDGAPATAQETGAKVNARPSKLTLSQRLEFFIQKVANGFDVPQDQPTTRMWFIADEATHNLGGYAQAYLDGFSLPAQAKGAGSESLYTNAYDGLADAETNRVQRPTRIACSVATDPNCPPSGYYTEVEEAYVGFKQRHEPKFDSVGANDTTERYEVEGAGNAILPLSWIEDRSAQSGQSWADEVGCKLPRVASILGFIPQGCRSSAPNSNIPNNNQQACYAKQHLFEPSCSGTVCYEAILARTLTQTQCKGKVLNPYYAIAIALNENGGLIATDTQGTNVKHFGCDPFGNTSYPTTIDGKLTCMLNTFTSYCEDGKSQAESLSTYGYVPSNKLDGIINTLGGNDTNLYVSAAQAQSYAQSLRFHLNSTAGRDLWRRYYQPVVNDYQNNCEQ